MTNNRVSSRFFLGISLLLLAVGLQAQWLPATATDATNITHSGTVTIGTTAPSTTALLKIGTFPGFGTTYGLLVGPTLTGAQYDRAMQIGSYQTVSPSGNSIVLYLVPTIESGVTVPAQYGIYVDQKQGSGSATNYYPAVFMGGKVGIGTPTPTEALDVVGNINVSGNINAKYQDVAEWVPVLTKMQPGTVVIVSADRHNEVMPSAHAYDTAVAGVVSAQPGLTLGEGSDNKAKIATTGRVKVHVDATKHAIKSGDLLVTSDKPGTAMLSEPVDLGGIKLHRPGTLIGKALEPLAGGEGDILVLLSLQ
jgi:hypothetical protein